VGQRKGQGQRGRFLGLTGALVAAVRREAEQAVAHRWGVSEATVWRGRRTLGVPATDAGTSRLRHDHAPDPAIAAGRHQAQAEAWDPERRARSAAGEPGRPRPTGAAGGLAGAAARTGPAGGTRRRTCPGARAGAANSLEVNFAPKLLAAGGPPGRRRRATG
jgi:hypothetical protein